MHRYLARDRRRVARDLAQAWGAVAPGVLARIAPVQSRAMVQRQGFLHPIRRNLLRVIPATKSRV